MPSTLYEALVPISVQFLGALSGILDKGAAFAASRKVDQQVLISARLFPDMWPLSTQVQQATSLGTRGVARLAVLRFPSLDDATASFADLARRIAAAIAFLKSVDAEAVNRGEDKDITFPLGDEQRSMKGRDYIQVFILPNFFLSVTTAYNILRNNGVALDRQDFVGGDLRRFGPARPQPRIQRDKAIATKPATNRTAPR